jgi:hypothetical protein
MEQNRITLVVAIVILPWVTPALPLAQTLFKRVSYRWEGSRLLPAGICLALSLFWPAIVLLDQAVDINIPQRSTHRYFACLSRRKDPRAGKR